MIKIVVLDGYTLGTSGAEWDIIRALGETTVYDRTPPSEIVSRAKDAEIILTNKCVLSGEVIGQLPNLKYIGVLATGYNVVDLKSAANKGIVVTNIPAYSTESVVQTTFGLIIDCYTKISELSFSVKEGKWEQSEDFSYYNTSYRELAGKTLGIIGYGKIGQRICEVAHAFGMKVVVYDKGRAHNERGIVFYSTLEDLLPNADIISLHCPLTAENAKMINNKTIALMKQDAVLINTARGALIDENALAHALNSGKLSAVGLDVLSQEPPKGGNPLISAKNAIVTPHIAWASREARSRLMQIAASNIQAFLAGEVINKVN
ncbi:MAG: D-2-hydroxyacid dehydrogenase [Clostridia bacterium]